MKSLDYHQDESKIGPGKFFLGLNIVLALFIFFTYSHQYSLVICIVFLVIAHLLYWLARPLFIQFSRSWIALSDRLSALLTPGIFTIFYFLIFVPYALFSRVFLSKPKTGWIESSYPVDFDESF